MQILSDDDVHHRVHQRVIGGRQQRDPLIRQRSDGIGITRIDNDKARAVAFHLLEVVIGMAKDGFVGVVAPQNHQRGFQQRIQRATGGRRAVGIRRGGSGVAHTHGVIVLKVAAGQVQQAAHHFIPGEGAAADGGADVHVARGRAIFSRDPLQIVSDERGSLIPADFFKLPFATLADALHRVFQAVRMIDKFTVAAPANTGAHDRHRLVQFTVRQCGNARNNTLIDVGANIAFAAAVESATGGHHAPGVLLSSG